MNPSPKTPLHPVNALILVFHGGTVLDTLIESSTKLADLSCFRNSLEAVSRQHFATLSSGRLAVRLVSCPSLCPDANAVLTSLSPFEQETDQVPNDPAVASSQNQQQQQQQQSGAGVEVGSNSAAATGVSSSWPPLGCLPLFAASSPDYTDAVHRCVLAANQTYAEFIKSPEGAGFSGMVAVVADAVGSILLYDVLCKEQDGQSRCGSENSIAEDPEDSAAGDSTEKKTAADHFNPAASARPTGRSATHLQAPPHRRPSSTCDVTGDSTAFR